MRKKIYTGYEVRTPDLKSIRFTNYYKGGVEKCKEYCPPGYVIVRTHRKRFGIKLRISWMAWYKPIRFKKRLGEFNFFWLHVNWNWLTIDDADKEDIVYVAPPKNETECED